MFPTSFDEAVKTGFLPYILEAEGKTNLCSTRTTKINAIIKDFKYIVSLNKNPNNYIDEVLAKYGFTQDDLTDAECNRINSSINGHF